MAEQGTFTEFANGYPGGELNKMFKLNAAEKQRAIGPLRVNAVVVNSTYLLGRRIWRNGRPRCPSA